MDFLIPDTFLKQFLIRLFIGIFVFICVFLAKKKRGS